MRKGKFNNISFREPEIDSHCIHFDCNDCGPDVICKWKQLRTGETCDGCEFYHRVYGEEFSDTKYCHNKSVPNNCKLYNKV
jgi:hypothetical protein